MRKNLRALTLIELVAVAGLLSAVLGVSVSSVVRFRELSKRLVCSMNLKGIGAVTQIYADNHLGQWMVPPFKAGAIDQQGIDYVMDGAVHNTPPVDPGEVGYERMFESTSETAQFPDGGSTAMSVTRAMWMLVRSGDVYRKQFICPSSFDVADDTGDATIYYDFKNYTNISYGYQVPFGPRDTRPRAGADLHQILAADKGPFYFPRLPDWNVGDRGDLIDLDDPAKAWRPFNSPNHGSWMNGEGQNCLFPDGSVCFQSIPAVGVDHDNIYTLMTDEWSHPQGFNRIHGDPPYFAPVPNPYPGQEAFGQGPGRFASTDSLIYP